MVEKTGIFDIANLDMRRPLNARSNSSWFSGHNCETKWRPELFNRIPFLYKFGVKLKRKNRVIRHIETNKAPPAFSNYSQAVAVPGTSELIYISGQVGVTIDGILAEGEAEQHEQIWRNILGLLEAEGLGAENIVEITAYITRQSGVPLFRHRRDKMLNGAKPASTLVIVSGLADPAWLAEISAIAAKPA